LVPLLYLWALRHVLPWDRRGWLAALGIALSSVGVACAVELGPGAPQSITSGVLWLASIPCFGLLGLGWWLTNPRRGLQP